MNSYTEQLNHSSYICCGSGEPCQGKPWITLRCDRWDDVTGPVTFSSYLHYRNNLDKIPRDHFHLIQNKEDFNEIRPVIHQPVSNEFIFLTETEINDLTNEQYSQYKLDYEEACFLNETKSRVYEEGLHNDEYTRSIEEAEDTDELDLYSDDY